MKSIGEEFLRTDALPGINLMHGMQYQIVHNLLTNNDIVTTIGRGNDAMIVILDLSAAFDTNHHDNLLYS